MALDKRDAVRQATRALERREPHEALKHLWPLVDRAHVAEEELASYLRLMGRAYNDVGLGRAAATILLFLGQSEDARRMSADHPTDMARAAVQGEQPTEAARHYQDAGWLGHAAIQLEDAGDHRSARVLWERLADDPRLSSEPYTQGLVRFNLGRASKRLGDRAASRRAMIESMHLIEAAADGFETQGLRERAFDCFQILLTLGKEGAFENLAEGYLNCIRILKEDNLKYYVLQYYEDFQALALESGELHAAATLFREAAEFARRHNLPYERHYRQRAAETQVSAAEKAMADGGLVEMAENAYAAAIDAYNDLGAYSAVRGVYGRLAELPLADKRRARYRRLQKRLEGVEDDATQIVAFPDYLRMDTAYPEIWRLDVIEWEQGGDAAETMGEVLADSKWPDFTRRRALLCRLHQLSSAQDVMSPSVLVGLAARLGKMEIYAALAPLEHLYKHTDGAVRVATMKATRQLFFKRSFILVAQGLKDEEPKVRGESLEAIQSFHFAHAYDPLQRIYRESANAHVRRAALSSIGKVPTVEAAEMLISVLRQGDADERTLCRELLAKADHPEVDNLLRRAAAEETGPLKQVLDRILRSR